MKSILKSFPILMLATAGTATLHAQDVLKDKNPGAPSATHPPVTEEVDTKNAAAASQTVTKKPNILVEQDGMNTYWQNADDFIFLMMPPIEKRECTAGGTFFVTKDSSFKGLLDARLKEWKEEDNKSIADIFRFLVQTEALSPQETIAWIQANTNTLPSPFLMICAIRLAELKDKTWQDWYRLSLLRMGMDAKKCKDPSAEEAIGQIVVYLRNQLLAAVGGEAALVKVLSPESQANSLHNALNLHKTYPNSNRAPYWMVFHGGNALQNVPDENSFFPKARWAQIEEDIMKGLVSKVPVAGSTGSAAAAKK